MVSASILPTSWVDGYILPAGSLNVMNATTNARGLFLIGSDMTSFVGSAGQTATKQIVFSGGALNASYIKIMFNIDSNADTITAPIENYLLNINGSLTTTAGFGHKGIKIAGTTVSTPSMSGLGMNSLPTTSTDFADLICTTELTKKATGSPQAAWIGQSTTMGNRAGAAFWETISLDITNEMINEYSNNTFTIKQQPTVGSEWRNRYFAVWADVPNP